MANLFPRTLIADQVKSKAEVKVFAALGEALDEEWDVYHSVSWMIRDHAQGSKDGEIDFVLCHPEWGIICLEVKGGGLECRHGEWFRVAGGGRERMKDPFVQALDHRYDLERKIAEQDGWKHRKLFIGHALAFPDISVHKLVLSPDAPPEIVIDRHGMAEIAESIDRVLDYHAGSRDKRVMPGEEGKRMLRELLAPDVLIEVPLAAEFVDEESDLIALTHDQANLLARFGNNRRMAVHGCAGSGKTMLAIEQAKRLGRRDLDVLFVCFNRALRDHLRDREQRSGITFNTFHGLCFALASEAKVELPKYEQDKAPPEFYSEELPLALMEAMETLGPRFDAIVVDEAQDLSNPWLDALLTTLRDPDEDYVWLFLDDNQRVYDSELVMPPGFTRFDLTVNCRNTQAIHAEVLKKYKGDIEPEVVGPPGRDVELMLSADQADTVEAVIQRLCGDEEVEPQDVVVLSSHAIEKSEVGQSDPGSYTFVKEPKPLGPYVRFSSIRGFKGLESPVVILCELDDLDDQTYDQQLYVGLSRARNHCVIVGPQPG